MLYELNGCLDLGLGAGKDPRERPKAVSENLGGSYIHSLFGWVSVKFFSFVSPIFCLSVFLAVLGIKPSVLSILY